MSAFNIHRVPCRKSAAARTLPLLVSDRRTDCMHPDGHGQGCATGPRNHRPVRVGQEADLGRSVTSIGTSPSLLMAARLRMETTAESPLTSGGLEMTGDTVSHWWTHLGRSVTSTGTSSSWLMAARLRMKTTTASPLSRGERSKTRSIKARPGPAAHSTCAAPGPATGGCIACMARFRGHAALHQPCVCCQLESRGVPRLPPVCMQRRRQMRSRLRYQAKNCASYVAARIAKVSCASDTCTLPAAVSSTRSGRAARKRMSVQNQQRLRHCTTGCSRHRPHTRTAQRKQCCASWEACHEHPLPHEVRSSVPAARPPCWRLPPQEPHTPPPAAARPDRTCWSECRRRRRFPPPGCPPPLARRSAPLACPVS